MTEAGGSCFLSGVGHCACRLRGFRRAYLRRIVREFGYFEENDLNLLEYHSLKDQVKGFNFHNDEIWTIVEQEEHRLPVIRFILHIRWHDDERSPLP